MNLRPFLILFFLPLGFLAHAQQQGFPDNYDPLYYRFEGAVPGVDYLPKTIIFKIRREHAVSNPALVRYLGRIGADTVKKIFPLHRAPVQERNTSGQRLTDLSRIYRFTYTADVPVEKVMTEIAGLGILEYVQPQFIDQPMDKVLREDFVPNDTMANQQWYLKKMHLYEAWDIHTGSAVTTVGIVDGGTHFTHPDLAANVAYNLGDPIDGIDNDNDGFIDNYRGWDVGDNDNNPQFVGYYNSAHGTAMCGLAAATTNNVAGVAGIGYNCSYLPVKMVNAVYGYSAGYEGIVYAADHGAKGINCSWGNTFAQPYGQDVVNYAAINRGVQVIAAAGNANNTAPFYPASFEHVISIAGTDSLNRKSPGSTYNYFVDVSAPGERIREVYDIGYGYGYGTSDASAIATGFFGLVQSYFNTLSPPQVGAVMIQTAVRLDTIPYNAPFANRQGTGRLDALRALTEVQRPFIFFSERNYTDGNDDIFLVGDTVTLSGQFINYLAGSSALLDAKITSLSPAFLEVTDSLTSPGILSPMGVFSSVTDPFRMVVKPACPPNQPVLLKVQYSDGAALNTQYFTLYVNQSYYHLRENGLHTTITNTGKIGFYDNGTRQGVGYRYNGGDNQLLGTYYNPMGFWIGSSSKVSDEVLGNPTGGCCPFSSNQDFVEEEPLKRIFPPLLADAELESRYNDNGAGAEKLDISVLQRSFAWSGTAADSNYIVLEYTLENRGATGIADLYAGIFSDFDMAGTDSLYEILYNYASYDAPQKTGIVKNPGDSLRVGVKVLSAGLPVSYYAFNSDGSSGSIALADGFSTAEKWSAISGGVLRPASTVTDVAQYIGVKIDSLAPGGCTVVAFALLIAPSHVQLMAVANAAALKYDQLFTIWTGAAGNNDWHDPANWSPNGVPGFSDYVVIPDVSASLRQSPVIQSADAQAGHVEIKCGGSLRLSNGYKLFTGN